MQLLMACFLLSSVLLVNAGVSRIESKRSLFGLFREDNSMGLAERQCISDSIKKLAEQHPKLKQWLNEVENLYVEAVEKANKCNKLQGEDKEMCLLEAFVYLIPEWKRLFEQLTEEQKPILSELEAIAKYCAEFRLKPSPQ